MATIFVEDANNVVLQNLDVEGQGFSGKSYVILYENSGGTVQSCTASPNTIGDMNSVAVAAWDNSDLAIKDCDIKNFGRIGIYTNNATTLIEGNTIVGQVYSLAGEVNYGIEIEDYSGPSKANITQNVIYDCNNTNPSPSWSSAAIIVDTWRYFYALLPSTVTMTYNTIYDNYESIEIVANEFSYAHNNTFYNNTWGVWSDPEFVTGNPYVFDARYNWWGNDTGPNHSTSWMYMGNPYGPHLGSGDIVGDYVLYDPWLPLSQVVYNHDIAIWNLDATPAMTEIGGMIDIVVTAKNVGNATETFTLTTTYGSHVETEPITDLLPEDEITFNYHWDTTGEEKCVHFISATAGPVAGEVHTFDNTRLTSVRLVTLLPPPTNLKISPSSAKGYTRNYIEINVTINDLDAYWDLAGFDVQIAYNTTMLDAIEVRLGDFCERFNLTLQIINEINDGEGYVHMVYLWDFAHVPPEERPTPFGSGTLFTIRFRAVHAGQDDVSFDFVEMGAFPNASKWCNELSTPIGHTVEEGVVKTVLSMREDVNADGKIDILDVVLASGSYATRPGDPLWNPDADLDGDGRITILDLVKITRIYGYHYDP
jgi:hypothetical protein